MIGKDSDSCPMKNSTLDCKDLRDVDADKAKHEHD